jgi:hypothetical protein
VTSENYGAEAEILKLARVLGVEPERLAYLARVDADDLQAFREQVTDTLFDANAAALQRMALAARVVPVGVLAKIAEKVFGPLLCARIAGLVDVARGVDVAKRLGTRFLAEVAAELDPRRADAIITRIPLDTVLAVAGELARKQDWITLGRFVGTCPTPRCGGPWRRSTTPACCGSRSCSTTSAASTTSSACSRPTGSAGCSPRRAPTRTSGHRRSTC